MEKNLEKYSASVSEIGYSFIAKDITEESRLASWEFCYGLAQCMYRRKKELTDYDYDYMALNLAFYLASWGMYRGSSFLLKKSYKVHIEPIKLIFSKTELWTGLLSSEELTQFGKDLAIAYGLVAIDYDNEDNDNGPSGMTDTLCTKILLGLTGNVIAYDRYCKEALSFLGYGRNFFRNVRLTSWDKLSEKGFKFLAKELTVINCQYTKVAFLNNRYIQTKEKEQYPKAKYVDMFLFVLGGICDAVKNYCDDNSSEKKKTASKDFLFNCFDFGLKFENEIFQEVIEERGYLEKIQEIYNLWNEKNAK